MKQIQYDVIKEEIRKERMRHLEKKRDYYVTENFFMAFIIGFVSK